MKERTLREPIWIQFGSGNFFRALPAAMMQKLLDCNAVDRGIVLVANRDSELIDKVFRPNNHETTLVTLKSDGEKKIERIRSIAEAYCLTTEFSKIAEIIEQPSLQMATFTITEKAYVASDFWRSIAELLRRRMIACGTSLAMVSFDNCSLNGDKLREALLSVVQNDELLQYISDKISFPITMVDKITPNPDKNIARELNMPIYTTQNSASSAQFVNAEEAGYLVLEDKFPNGRPPLELAGAIFTDRETVAKTEYMKVSRCLNPLHTALAIYGCLFKYARISDGIRDPLLLRLVKKLGYDEGLPVTQDPKILSSQAFLDEVINVRLPNPAIPDTPQRIVTDTSQKLPIRIIKTINAYGRNALRLTAAPLVIAGWLRYLKGTDDFGMKIDLSPDPLLPELLLKTPEEILADTRIFGNILQKSGLDTRIIKYFYSMLNGIGAVRKTLTEELKDA